MKNWDPRTDPMPLATKKDMLRIFLHKKYVQRKFCGAIELGGSDQGFLASDSNSDVFKTIEEAQEDDFGDFQGFEFEEPRDYLPRSVPVQNHVVHVSDLIQDQTRNFNNPKQYNKHGAYENIHCHEAPDDFDDVQSSDCKLTSVAPPKQDDFAAFKIPVVTKSEPVSFIDDEFDEFQACTVVEDQFQVKASKDQAFNSAAGNHIYAPFDSISNTNNFNVNKSINNDEIHQLEKTKVAPIMQNSFATFTAATTMEATLDDDQEVLSNDPYAAFRSLETSTSSLFEPERPILERRTSIYQVLKESKTDASSFSTTSIWDSHTTLKREEVEVVSPPVLNPVGFRVPVVEKSGVVENDGTFDDLLSPVFNDLSLKFTIN